MANPFTSAQAPLAMQMASPDYALAQQQLTRQQLMADALRKQSLEPMGDTQVINGWAIQKSPLEGLSKIAQALGANYSQSNVDDKQIALAKQLREQRGTDMQGVMSALNGSEAKPAAFTPDTFDSADKAATFPEAQYNDTPAVAPDRNLAMSRALNSQDPMIQGVGAKLMEAQLKAPEWVLGEKFSDTGMPQKFMYNKNNPAQIQNIGGEQAQKIISDNLGGKNVYRGEYSAAPITSVDRTVTPDAIMADSRIRSEGAANRGVTIRGQNMTDSRTKEMNGIMADGTGVTDVVANTAKAIASGQLAPLSGFALAKPMGQQIMAEVMKINPQYNAQNYSTSQKADKDFATGKQGQAVKSFNVALDHLDTLDKLSDALNNKDTQALNKLGNYYATQTGGTAPTNFAAAKKIVSDEVTKAIIGAGGTGGDREEAAKTISAASSPAQLKGVIATYKELMKGQLNGLGAQYKATTGRQDFESRYLSDKARAVEHGGNSQQPNKVVDFGSLK